MTASTVIYYPGYSQVQVHNTPLKRVIASITNATLMHVIFTEPHGYQTGQNIAFSIPGLYGMQDLNVVDADIIRIISDVEIETDIDSTYFSTFAFPSPMPNAYTLPYAIPNAEAPLITPEPLPYGNQRSFFATVYNNGIN